jgi:cytosine/adenosine deaminase-related metal-dependent hydrolase
MSTTPGGTPVQEIKVGRLFAHPGHAGCLYGATIRIADGKIVSVEASGDAATAGAGRRYVAMPALADAHDHGRGLHHLAIGARDQMFELWRAALYAHPPVDPYLNTALAFARLARAGISSVMHVHSSILVDQLPDHAERVARAARDVGIRLSFVVPLRDQNTMGLEDDEAMLARHDAADRERIRRTWLYPFPSPASYMDLVRAIAAKIDGPTVSVQYGPNSPQACSEALIEAMCAASAADGRRITTHLHETRQQQEWGDAKFREGFMQHYDAMGLFSERFTGAHGVWLRPADVELMAARGASVAVNMSSNFRLRSGIAPVGQYIKSGMRFAFGIDAFSIDDDDDAFRELRLAHWLHSPSYAEHPLTPARLFDAWLECGYHAVNNVRGYGKVEPGAPADLVLLDYEAMSYDMISDSVDELDVLLTRAGNRHVDRVIVAGREVVRDGRPVGVDVDEIEREVLAQARAAKGFVDDIQPVLARSQATLERFYRGGGHRSVPGDAR